MSSTISLLPAAQAVAAAGDSPIFRVPVLTALITKLSTVPSTSAALLLANRLAKVTVIWLSSLPLATAKLKGVKVGASLTALPLKVSVPVRAGAITSEIDEIDTDALVLAKPLTTGTNDIAASAVLTSVSVPFTVHTPVAAA